MRFSKELIADIKEYFHKKSGIELSDTDANIYLEKLGSLGLVIVDALTESDHYTDPSPAEEDSGRAAGISAVEGRVSGGTHPVAQCPQSAYGDSRSK